MRVITFTAVLAVLASPAIAQGEKPTAVPEQKQVEPAQDPKPVQVSTDTFVDRAALTNMFEVQAGKLALEKAQSEEVKAFAEQMVQDHSKLQARLIAAVEHHEVDAEAPDELNAAYEDMLSELEQAQPQEFDHLYANIQVQTHREAVNLFTNYAKSGENKVLRLWAEGTVDALRKHYQMAQNLPRVGKLPAT